MDKLVPQKYRFWVIGSFLFNLAYVTYANGYDVNSNTTYLKTSSYMQAYSTSTYLNLASNTFIFSPRTLTWKAVKDGKVVRSGRASGGSKYCSDIGRACRTPSGTYSIISKGSASCRSSRYPRPHGGAKMPYCMFFSRYYAIHGSYDVPNHNASHGCIRVRPNDALWLHQNFIKIGTRVVVNGY